MDLLPASLDRFWISELRKEHYVVYRKRDTVGHHPRSKAHRICGLIPREQGIQAFEALVSLAPIGYIVAIGHIVGRIAGQRVLPVNDRNETSPFHKQIVPRKISVT